jgi:GNAT acetyltransferase-like protein
MVETYVLDSRSPSDRKVVDEICDMDPTATIYQTTDWWELQEEVFGYKTFYVYASSGSRYCLLPLSGVKGIPTTSRLACLPLTQFCSPLYSDGQMLSEAIRFAIGLRRQKHYSALVIKPRFELPAAAHEQLESRQFYKDYWIDLRNRKLDNVWDNMSSSERRKIRRADKAAVTIEADPNDKEIAELNSIMLRTTKRHNVPAYPKNLLLFIKEKMSKHAKIYVSKLGGKTMAGIVVFSFRSSSIYGYGFTLPEYFYTGSVPMMIWRAITDSFNESRERFDLGTSSPNDGGLSTFKTRFGAVCDDLPFYFEGAKFEELVFDPKSSARFLSKLYGLMPLGLHSLVGPHIVSRFG